MFILQKVLSLKLGIFILHNKAASFFIVEN